MSDADHGAAAAATAAMDAMSTDPEPDTEVHVSLTTVHLATPDDSTRADLLLAQIREALKKYKDVRLAAADGFEELPTSDGKHTIHHLSNWSWARAEARRFDPSRPTSLLYPEGSDGALTLMGAMYTAPAASSVDDLNRRIPVSLARWHQHVNWCEPHSGGGAQWLATRGGSPVFGRRSSVTTRDACLAVGGIFHPAVFGWMVHVTFMGSDDPTIVWNGQLPGRASDSTQPRVVADRRVTAPVPTQSGAISQEAVPVAAPPATASAPISEGAPASAPAHADPTAGSRGSCVAAGGRPTGPTSA
jgi:hypothetical protein